MENSVGDPYNQYGYQWADPFYYARLKQLAAEMRALPTHAEKLLWQALRGKKLAGHKFRRQHIIGRYIADFVCLRSRLIIEVDGLIHQLPDNQLSDAERQDELEKMGFTVLRFSNEAVEQSLETVLKSIAAKLRTLSPDL